MMNPPDKLRLKIQRFYDRSSALWQKTWGEHMHHGFYPEGMIGSGDHLAAQVEMLERLLAWGKITAASTIFDAGCGVGGSSRYLAKKLNARVLGATLSRVQAESASRLSAAAGGANSRFLIADVLHTPVTDAAVDLVWSLESAEHMAPKEAMLREFFRLLCPDGKLLLATWCHRETPPPLSRYEQNLLRRVCRAYYLPPLLSISALGRMAVETGFTDVKSDDWTAAVAPFWPAVWKSALRVSNIGGMLQAGWPTMRGAWAIRRMIRGYRCGVIRFAVLQGRRP